MMWPAPARSECAYGDAMCPCRNGEDCPYAGADPIASNWVSVHAIRKLRAAVGQATALIRTAEWDDWSDERQQWVCGRCGRLQSVGHDPTCSVGRWLAAHPEPAGVTP